MPRIVHGVFPIMTTYGRNLRPVASASLQDIFNAASCGREKLGWGSFIVKNQDVTPLLAVKWRQGT
jgi:hypothetical protein